MRTACSIVLPVITAFKNKPSNASYFECFFMAIKTLILWVFGSTKCPIMFNSATEIQVAHAMKDLPNG